MERRTSDDGWGERPLDRIARRFPRGRRRAGAGRRLRELNSYLVDYCRSNFCRTAPLCGIDQSPFPRDGYGVAGGEAAGINGLRRHPTSSVPRTGRWLESTRKRAIVNL